MIALGLALLLTNGITLAHFHRVVMYLPRCCPCSWSASCSRSILNPATGLLNTFLRSVGLDFLAQRWLVDVDWALPSVIGVDTWRGWATSWSSSLPASSRSAGLLRGRGHRRSQRVWRLLAHHPAPADARADCHHGAEPAVWAQGVRYRVRADERRICARRMSSTRSSSMNSQRDATASPATLSTLLFIIMIVLGYFVIRLMHRDAME